MKKILFSAALFIVIAVSAVAQGFNPTAPLPNDPAYRYGKLDNGLTYYLVHNELPAQRADFYLVTNVGAIQETPAQDGLAHFLEHMCLNGTKNLPGKMMLDYFAKVGVEFGRNINAGTGVEQTSYMLTDVPTIRQGIIDTALLILHDYSHFVTNDPAEIEAERGVIVEEWRTRRTADWRMHEAELPYLYGGSKYETCTLIGSKTNLETFEPHHLVDFYQTWYRPDMQAIIISGDIDVNAIEAQLKTLFADVPAAGPDAQQKVMPTIPDNAEPVVGIITDPEARATSIAVYVKYDPIPFEYRTLGLFGMNDIMISTLTHMFNERLNDIAMQQGAPFLSAYGRYNNFWVRTKDALTFGITSRDGEGIKAFKAVADEIEKARRYGFTDAEYERAKTSILREYELAADNAATRRNGDFIYPAMGNFLLGIPYMDPKVEFETVKAIFSMLSVQALNQAAAQVMTLGNNTIVLYKSIAKEGLEHPTAEQFKEVIAAMPSAEIAAPVAEEVNEPFISNEAALKGSAVKKESAGPFGSQLWTLKNGIKVYVLPTDYKKDEVLFSIGNKGGRSIIATEDLPSIESNVFSILNNYLGVSKFPATKLQKMLTGKAVSLNPSLDELYQGFSGNCSSKDIETMLQILYLCYTDARYVESEAQPALDYLASFLPNIEKMPKFKFQGEATRYLYENNPRQFFINSEVFAKFNFDAYVKAMKALFTNAAGATVTFVGDFDVNTLKPMVEKYIGSLPVGKKAPEYIDHKYSVIKGVNEHPFNVAMETPMATACVVYSGDMEYTNENIIKMNALSYILDLIYTEEIREKEGGTYGVSSICEVQPAPDNKFLIQVIFDTDVDKSEKLVQMAKDLFAAVGVDGPTQEQVDKAKENALKNISESRISNRYWQNRIALMDKYGIDRDTDYEAQVNALTPEAIRDFVKKIVDSNNRSTLLMLP